MQKWFYVNCVVSIGIWFIQFRYWSHTVWWFPFFRQWVVRFVYNKKVQIILIVFLPFDVIIFTWKTWWECLLNCSSVKWYRKYSCMGFILDFKGKYSQICLWLNWAVRSYFRSDLSVVVSVCLFVLNFWNYLSWELLFMYTDTKVIGSRSRSNKQEYHISHHFC